MATHSSVLAWRIHGQRSWRAAVHGVAKSRTRLSDSHLRLFLAFINGLTTYLIQGFRYVKKSRKTNRI